MRSKPHGSGGRLRWSNGLKNVRAGRYYVTQLLARTVGSSAEKILYTVAPSHYANVVSSRPSFVLLQSLTRMSLADGLSRLRFHTS